MSDLWTLGAGEQLISAQRRITKEKTSYICIKQLEGVKKITFVKRMGFMMEAKMVTSWKQKAWEKSRAEKDE